MTASELAAPLETMWEGRFITALRRGEWEYVARAREIRAVVILAEHDGKIILVEQERVPIGRRCLELPAGLVGDHDPSATVEGTAISELEEETGFTASHVERLGDFYSSPGMVAEGFTLVRAHCVRATGEEAEAGIEVHCIARDALADFVADKREEGVGIDVKLLLLLGGGML